MKRIFLIVLDSFGIGAMPDSESFGDVGILPTDLDTRTSFAEFAATERMR